MSSFAQRLYTARKNKKMTQKQLADQLGRHRMRSGDIVYGRRGDIGRKAFIGARQEGWLCRASALA